MNNFLVAQFDSGFQDLSKKCMLPPGTTETAILDQYVQGFPTARCALPCLLS